jgi:hypothetical protein
MKEQYAKYGGSLATTLPPGAPTAKDIENK